MTDRKRSVLSDSNVIEDPSVQMCPDPQEQHQADTVKRLEAFNTAKEIAAVENAKQAKKRTGKKEVPTVFTTVPDPAPEMPAEHPSIN